MDLRHGELSREQRGGCATGGHGVGGLLDLAVGDLVDEAGGGGTRYGDCDGDRNCG